MESNKIDVGDIVEYPNYSSNHLGIIIECAPIRGFDKHVVYFPYNNITLSLSVTIIKRRDDLCKVIHTKDELTAWVEISKAFCV